MSNANARSNGAAPATMSSSSSNKANAGKTFSLADKQNVVKRLQTELMQLMMSATPGISAFPNGDDLTEWKATVAGPPGSAYDSLAYKLSMSFPINYPFAPPIIKFITPCWHPNVDNAGNICLDILKEKWSAVYNVQTILLSLQSLLGEANVDSPLNGHAAKLYSNTAEYTRTVQRKYKESASHEE